MFCNFRINSPYYPYLPMQTATRLSLSLLLPVFILFSCKKDDAPSGYEKEINAVAGVYQGWEYLKGSSFPGTDSNAVNITVTKIDNTTFEISYPERSDAYPRKFSYKGNNYSFAEGGSFAYYHTIDFFPAEQKMELDISYDDGQGHWGNIHFIGKK